MEENSAPPAADQTNSNGEDVEGWISPEVAAAEAGERVEMGKSVQTTEEE